MRTKRGRTERVRAIVLLYICIMPRVRVSVAHFLPRYNALVSLARAGLSCVRYCMYVYRYCYWLALLLFSCSFARSVPSAVGLPFLIPLVSCRLALLSVAVAIWCNRATMRCNRFSVFGGVVLPCVLSCDCGAFYKRLLCVWLMACAGLLLCWLVWDGGTACVFACPCGLCFVLLAVVLLGVRMARVGFKCISIYLYTVAVGVACGAFSCSCGGLACGWCCVGLYVWMYASKVCSVWRGGVVRVYLCIYVYNALVLSVVVWWCARA